MSGLQKLPLDGKFQIRVLGGLTEEVKKIEEVKVEKPVKKSWLSKLSDKLYKICR